MPICWSICFVLGATDTGGWGAFTIVTQHKSAPSQSFREIAPRVGKDQCDGFCRFEFWSDLRSCWRFVAVVGGDHCTPARKLAGYSLFVLKTYISTPPSAKLARS